ncbi:MAG: GNAT family N-acetyltransferase [Propionibacteriaceae bacterium]|nr:GNAT family N-acetyltransferase [Propionibacteriaceae bacterium]
MSFSPPRPIHAHDQLTSFDCGEPSLNQWLKQTAVRAELAKTARTYVTTCGEVIAGYYCLSAFAVARDAVGGGKLARNAPRSVPAVLLGRLAVDLRFQGQGLGADLLFDAICRAKQVAALIGSRALIVEALTDAAAEFYLHHDFVPFPSDPSRLFHAL